MACLSLSQSCRIIYTQCRQNYPKFVSTNAIANSVGTCCAVAESGTRRVGDSPSRGLAESGTRGLGTVA
eukprot:727112-Hanusia_phi.AAC.1